MSTSDEKPITDEDILEKIKEMRHQLVHGQTKSSVIRLVNDPDRNEYSILFKINTANTRSQLRTGELGVHISQTVEGGKGEQVQVRRSTRVDNLSDHTIIEITRNLLKYVERFFETAPDKKKQRKDYEEYVRVKNKETSWDKSGNVPVLVCQKFEIDVESQPQNKEPQARVTQTEVEEKHNDKTFDDAISNLLDLYHPAVIFMRLLKDYPDNFAYYVSKRMPFDKFDEFIHNVRRDEMTISDLYEKDITATHLSELLIDALRKKFDEAKNVPECLSISSIEKTISFVKEFCEEVCKNNEKPINVPYEVATFITVCEGLGFSSAKSVHALLRACYDSVDNMMNFFNGTFKWSDTMVDDPKHFLGFLNGDYGMEMNENILLGDLYEALTARYPIKLLNKVATEMQCNYMGDSLIGDGTPQSKKFTRFLILLVKKLQSEEVNNEEPIQTIDTECFAVGVKGVSLEQFKNWLKYHPGASYELL